jgi:hypothetical protein
MKLYWLPAMQVMYKIVLVLITLAYFYDHAMIIE